MLELNQNISVLSTPKKELPLKARQKGVGRNDLRMGWFALALTSSGHLHCPMSEPAYPRVDQAVGPMPVYSGTKMSVHRISAFGLVLPWSLE